VIKKFVYLKIIITDNIMDAVSKILDLYYTLTTVEQAELLVKLNNESYGSEIKPLPSHQCPHCNSVKIVSNGSSNGNKRYLCRTCKKSFGVHTDTVLSHIKKPEKFLLFKNILFTEGVIPLKILCKRVGISIQTSFDWRHKLSICLGDSKSKLINEVQLDDIWVNYSQKGRRGLKYSKERGGSKKAGDNNYQAKVLLATNTHQTVMKVARIGRITKLDIERNLGNQFTQETKLVSDAHPSIAGFAKDNSIKHVSFKAKKHLAKSGENVQFLNGQASRFDTMINRTLKGVSTKYLQNYANLFSFLETNKARDLNKMASIAIMDNKKGWENFINIENNYKNFIENFSVRTYRCPSLRMWKANNWNMKNLTI
jgi:transposase-like protein